jgi:hypothetical protein
MDASSVAMRMTKWVRRVPASEESFNAELDLRLVHHSLNPPLGISAPKMSLPQE